MPEPRLHRIVVRHRQHHFEHYVFADNPEAAITTFGGPIAEAAARRGLLHAYPVTAEPGGPEAMTRTEVLDAIEARLASRRLDKAAAPSPGVDDSAETRRRFLAS